MAGKLKLAAKGSLDRREPRFLQQEERHVVVNLTHAVDVGRVVLAKYNHLRNWNWHHNECRVACQPQRVMLRLSAASQDGIDDLAAIKGPWSNQASTGILWVREGDMIHQLGVGVTFVGHRDINEQSCLQVPLANDAVALRCRRGHYRDERRGPLAMEASTHHCR